MNDILKINQNISLPQGEENKKISEEKFREVSELYERHFIREMMKQMRATVPEGGFIKQNNAEKIFRDQMDDQYSEQWSKSGGIGLSSIIYDQLVQKFGSQNKIKDKLEKPMGPIEFNSKNKFLGFNNLNAKFITDSEKPSALTNPWVGTLLDKKYLEADQMQYRIKHDNGLESLILSRGTGLGLGASVSQGDTIQPGQQLGLTSPASPLFWALKINVSE
jgi:flagellar protein FlgJ